MFNEEIYIVVTLDIEFQIETFAYAEFGDAEAKAVDVARDWFPDHVFEGFDDVLKVIHEVSDGFVTIDIDTVPLQ